MRNCEQTLKPLIYPGDFNIRVTVYSNNPKYYTPEAYYNAWIETIRDAIGGSIVHTDETHTFTIRQLGWSRSYMFYEKGSHLSEKIKFIFQKPVSFRLETVEEKPHAWVFFLENDLIKFEI